MGKGGQRQEAGLRQGGTEEKKRRPPRRGEQMNGTAPRKAKRKMRRNPQENTRSDLIKAEGN